MKGLTAQDWGLMIGQEIFYNNDILLLKGIEINGEDFSLIVSGNIMNVKITENKCKCKPILRTLDQVAEDEKRDIDWLTRKGFDVRGWIDAGLAVKKGG